MLLDELIPNHLAFDKDRNVPHPIQLQEIRMPNQVQLIGLFSSHSGLQVL